MYGMFRRFAIGILASLTLCAGMFFVAAPASAHSSLVHSDPANGASLSTAPTTVTLTFNEAIQDAYDVMTVVGPDGNYWHDGDATVTGAHIAVKVRPLGPQGIYTVNYRITSADGHPVQGQVRFTMTVAGSGTPGPSANASTSSDSTPVWPFIVGAVVVVAVISGGVIFWRRSRGTDGEGASS